MIKSSYVVVFLLLIFSACSSNKSEKEKPSSPRIKKASRVTAPNQNQSFARGSRIPVTVTSSEDFAIDSVVISAGGKDFPYTQDAFDLTMPTRRVGSWRLIVKVYSNEKSETHYRKVTILPENAPEEWTYEVQNTYPHDTEDYTQGLLVKDGYLYESTGQRGQSSFKKKDIITGETLASVNLSDNLFGEGLAELNDEFYQLTWTSGRGFVYNNEMKQVRTFNYQMEGWGLTSLGNELILTDESEMLYFIDPMSFTTQRELAVYDHEGKIEALNELEVIDGLIYANVYQTNDIVVIDSETGEVLRKIDMGGLLDEADANKADVLNGIALDEETGKIYVTGKWWPKLFEVTFQPKTIQ